MQTIDHGYTLLTFQEAKILSQNQLPGPGKEKLIAHEGQHYWLARTWYCGECRWSIRPTDWKLDKNNQAYLGS